MCVREYFKKEGGVCERECMIYRQGAHKLISKIDIDFIVYIIKIKFTVMILLWEGIT
jgi:hypothetical protein